MIQQLIQRIPAPWMAIYEDSIFITTTNKKRTYSTHRYSLDGVCQERLQSLSCEEACGSYITRQTLRSLIG